MASRRRSFNYLDLHDERFEELTFLLAHMEDPRAIKPGNPDRGLDAVVLDAEGGGAPRGFQAKHFTRSISWAQCRKSLDDAVANYGVRHLTFTFPVDLTGPQLGKFDAHLAGRHDDVLVDFWGASQLTARLIGSDDGERIARYIFGDEEFERLHRALRAGRDVDTAEQAIAALGAARDLFKGDPYFEYSVASRPESVDAERPAPGTVMRVETSDPSGVHQIDVHARPAAIAADQLPKGELRVAGEDAVRRIQEFLRVGGEVELESVELRWEQRPKYLEQILPDAEEGDVRLSSAKVLPARPMRFELETTTGRAALALDMQPTAPPSGWDHALSGRRGGAVLTVTLRRRGETGELNLNWHWSMDVAHSASEHLEALSFLEAAAGEGEVRIVEPETANVLITGESPQAPFDDTLEALKRILEDVLALERWLGRSIPVPDEITGNEANLLHWTARLIDGVAGTWTNANFTLASDPGDERMADGGIFQSRRSLAVDLFGTRYDLGEEVTYIEDFIVAESEHVDGGRRYVLRPRTGEARMLTRLEPVLADGDGGQEA